MGRFIPAHGFMCYLERRRRRSTRTVTVIVTASTIIAVIPRVILTIGHLLSVEDWPGLVATQARSRSGRRNVPSSNPAETRY